MSEVEFYALMPLIILAAAPIIIMLFIAVKRSHNYVNSVSLLLFAASFISLFNVLNLTPVKISSLLIIDDYSVFYIGLIIAASFIVTMMSYKYFEQHKEQKEEYYILLFTATLGSSVLVASTNFVSFFLGLEILSVSLYVMIAYLRTFHRSLEAGIKYLILAASSSAFLLFGMALVYAEIGSMNFNMIAHRLNSVSVNNAILLTGFALIIIGIGFKLAVVPFHMWTPDVYEGAPAPVTAFIATVSKGGMFALLLRFFNQVNLFQFDSIILIFSIIAVASMFFGNLLALMQENVKRILAYSSIAHLGYLLVAFIASGSLGMQAATFYLVAYIITTLGAFGIVSFLSTSDGEAEDIEDYKGLFWSRPWIAAVFSAMLFSLAGIPLTAGFIGKYYVLASGVGSSKWFLVVILVINSVIGLYYYLRIIASMYTKPDEIVETSKKPSFSLGGGVALAVLTILLIWFGVYPAGLMQLIRIVIGG